MLKFHISQANKLIGQDSHLPFWISMIQESQKVTDLKSKNIMDFGCGEGKLLRIIDLFDHSIQTRVGVEIDDNLIHIAISNINNDKLNYIHYRELPTLSNQSFDIIYSQEVLYTLPNLELHANEMFNLMAHDSYYFATMGCHTDNPLWEYRKGVIRSENTFPVNDYSLQDIVDVFHDAGFAVMIKRLPVTYSIYYDPIETKRFSKSIVDLVDNIYNYKMLFTFYKR